MTDLPADEVHDDSATSEATAPVAAPTEVEATDSTESANTGDPAEDLLADTEAEIAARSLTPVETGHPAVDEVLQSLQALDDLPVDEHVAVFEQAHDELRRTLSGAGDDPA